MLENSHFHFRFYGIYIVKKLIFCVGLIIALSAGQADAQSVTIFDNLVSTPTVNGQANVFFGGGPGFPNSRRQVGDVFTTGVSLSDTPGATDFRVDTVDFNLGSFENVTTALTPTQTLITDAFVRVDFFSGVTGATGLDLAANFSNNLIASRLFELGIPDGNSNFGGSVIVDGASDVDFVSLDFSTVADVLLGDAEDVAVSFRFSAGDPTSAVGIIDQSELLTIAFRNDADTAPLVGTSTTTNFRDENGNDIIDNADSFGFGTGAQLSFQVNATAIDVNAVPEPASAALIFGLGLIGLGSRRRRA